MTFGTTLYWYYHYTVLYSEQGQISHVLLISVSYGHTAFLFVYVVHRSMMTYWMAA